MRDGGRKSLARLLLERPTRTRSPSGGEDAGATPGKPGKGAPLGCMLPAAALAHGRTANQRCWVVRVVRGSMARPNAVRLASLRRCGPTAFPASMEWAGRKKTQISGERLAPLDHSPKISVVGSCLRAVECGSWTVHRPSFRSDYSPPSFFSAVDPSQDFAAAKGRIFALPSPSRASRSRKASSFPSGAK